MQETTTDVSVVLPVYNVASYIESTVRSVLEQRESVELIVVDDCSTDDTRRLIEAVADPRIRLLANSENRGPWFSRNVALDAARGEWVTFVDGDDWYLPGRLATLLRVARQCEADMVFDDMARFDESGTHELRTSLAARHVHLTGPTELTALEFIEWDLGVMKPLIRRGFLEKQGIRFNGSLRSGGDFSMFLSCMLRGARAVLVPEAHYAYRFRAGQVTSDRKLLFAGTRAATEEALAEAQSMGADDVGRALRRRLSKIRNQETLNSLLVSAREGEIVSALRALWANPAALRFLAQKLVQTGYIAEKLRIRRL